MTVQATAYESVSPLFLETAEQIHEHRKSMYVINDPTIVTFSGNPAFPERADYFPSGFFRRNGTRESFSFGNLIDWNGFIVALAKFADVDLKTIYDEPREGEFMELLAFPLTTPCRHFIGPQTSAKLLGDFKNNENRAREQTASFYDRYVKLTSAFQIAQKAGVVDFVTDAR